MGGDPRLYPYLTAEQNLGVLPHPVGHPRRSCVDEALELVRSHRGREEKIQDLLPWA